MRKIVATLVAALCCLLLGCGPSAEENQAAAEAEASASAEAEASASAEAEASASAEAEASASAEAEAEAAAEAKAKAAQMDAARATQGKCDEQMGDLLGTLKQIDGRLDVGLTNSDLGTRMGDVSVTYNDIPFHKLSPKCVASVGVPLENAYNEYTKSKTAWDACIDDYSCTVEGAVLAEMRGHWMKAGRLIDKADGFLASPKNFMSPIA